MYKVQITDESGNVVASWVPGSAAEYKFAQNVAEKAVTKGVGVFRTEAQVKARVMEAVNEVLFELKAIVRP
jgi:hypothetical protein